MERNEVKVGKEVIFLDPTFLKFNDRTLNDFFEKIGGRIDYIGQVLTACQVLHRNRVADMEEAYNKAYLHWRSEGSKRTEKWIDILAKEDADYKLASKKERAAFARKNKALQHLNALNAAREDAHNRGHFLRAEMKHLNMDVMQPASEAELEQILKDSSHYQRS